MDRIRFDNNSSLTVASLLRIILHKSLDWLTTGKKHASNMPLHIRACYNVIGNKPFIRSKAKFDPP